MNQTEKTKLLVSALEATTIMAATLLLMLSKSGGLDGAVAGLAIETLRKDVALLKENGAEVPFTILNVSFDEVKKYDELYRNKSVH